MTLRCKHHLSQLLYHCNLTPANMIDCTETLLSMLTAPDIAHWDKRRIRELQAEFESVDGHEEALEEFKQEWEIIRKLSGEH